MITAGFCSSFKAELLAGLHNLAADQIFMALYTGDAPLDLDLTTSYLTDGEVSGPGYTAGGKQLTNPQLLGPVARTAYVTFDDCIWPASTLTARCALIYNQTKAQRAVAILNFGTDQNSNQGNFRVKFPAPGPGTALVRLS